MSFHTVLHIRPSLSLYSVLGTRFKRDNDNLNYVFLHNHKRSIGEIVTLTEFS